jgi:hypothetical protein
VRLAAQGLISFSQQHTLIEDLDILAVGDR